METVQKAVEAVGSKLADVLLPEQSRSAAAQLPAGPESHPVDTTAPSFHDTHPQSPSKHHHHKVPFEERTYKMVHGAECPDGSVEALHLHNPVGDEKEGAPLSGKTQMFAPPAHGAYATDASQDRPIKIQPHDYRHETMEQRQADQVTSTEALSEGRKEEETQVLDPNEVPEAPAQHTPAGGTTHKQQPHHKNFEESTAQQIRGSVCVDGPVEALHLHASQGLEGSGSKADQQLGQVVHTHPHPPEGAGAPTSAQDPPDKMMPHSREEPGVAGRAGGRAETVAGGPAAAGGATTGSEAETATKHPHHQKDFEASTAQQVKGSVCVDGPVVALHLHAPQGLEGSGSKADQQLGQVVHTHPHPPEGAGAPTSAQDPPDKMMPHCREEPGMAGRAGGKAETITADSRGAGEPARAEEQLEGVEGGRLLKGEGIVKVAEALAEVTGSPAGAQLLHGQERQAQHEASEKALEEAKRHPLPEDLKHPHREDDAPMHVDKTIDKPVTA